MAKVKLDEEHYVRVVSFQSHISVSSYYEQVRNRSRVYRISNMFINTDVFNVRAILFIPELVEYQSRYLSHFSSYIGNCSIDHHFLLLR